MRLTGIDLLDGDGLRRGMNMEVRQGRVAHLHQGRPHDNAALVCPAPLDLQVNGGGGRMLGDCEAPGDVLEILGAHRHLGTGAILPTLISDSPATTRRIVGLVATARSADPGILGLHLEGPHLARPGAHDPAALRPMTEEDLAYYIAVRPRLGHLMLTVAPEQVTPEQIAALSEAGVIVALGHSDCSYEAACDALQAGARMVTHLFNAMSGLHHRAPGLAGAALDFAEAFGVIADGVHVHDAALRVALAARPDAAIPVSDAMAVAGTTLQAFSLGGRRIRRVQGRLVTEDGTLAGADLSMTGALLRIARVTGQALIDVLPTGFDRPHRLLTGKANAMADGVPARFLMIKNGEVWGFDGYNWYRLGTG